MQLIKCNLCNSSDSRQILQGYDRMHQVDKQLFNVVKCLKCQLVYLNPQPTSEELEKYYPDNYAPHTGQESDFKYGHFSKLFKKKQAQQKSVPSQDKSVINYLDFGCGGGFHLDRVRQSHPHWNLYGLDNSQTACQATAAKGFKVFHGDIINIDFPQDFFDKVNLNQVIEHLHRPEESLQKISKSMKKNSEIIISTPNINSLAFKIFRKYWYALDIPRHLFLFSSKTLSDLLESTGFKVKRITYKANPNVDIKSLYYLLHKKDLRINPFIWRLAKPISKILSKLHLSSIITIHANKK